MKFLRAVGTVILLLLLLLAIMAVFITVQNALFP
jgi:hypothetical protein